MRAAGRRIQWFVVVLAALAVAGCGGESEEPKPAPAAAPEKSAAPAPKKARVGARRSDVVVGHDYPADFPSDVPRYPGAEVKSSRSGANMGMAVVLMSADPTDKVFQFYADSLAADGWSTDIRDNAKGKMILADKGDRTAATMIRPSKDGGTRIRVFITQFAR